MLVTLIFLNIKEMNLSPVKRFLVDQLSGALEESQVSNTDEILEQFKQFILEYQFLDSCSENQMLMRNRQNDPRYKSMSGASAKILRSLDFQKIITKIRQLLTRYDLVLVNSIIRNVMLRYRDPYIRKDPPCNESNGIVESLDQFTGLHDLYCPFGRLFEQLSILDLKKLAIILHQKLLQKLVLLPGFSQEHLDKMITIETDNWNVEEIYQDLLVKFKLYLEWRNEVYSNNSESINILNQPLDNIEDFNMRYSLDPSAGSLAELVFAQLPPVNLKTDLGQLSLLVYRLLLENNLDNLSVKVIRTLHSQIMSELSRNLQDDQNNQGQLECDAYSQITDLLDEINSIKDPDPGDEIAPVEYLWRLDPVADHISQIIQYLDKVLYHK